MEKTILDHLTEQSLECQKDFSKVIIFLSALHRRIGELEGKTEILFGDVREQRDYCQGIDLIRISQLEGLLANIKRQLQELGLTKDEDIPSISETNKFSTERETTTNSNIEEE
ncbi:hypothetical protein [Planktothrix sp.]